MPRNYSFIILLAFLLAACTPNPISPVPIKTTPSPAIMLVAPELTETPAQKSNETPTLDVPTIPTLTRTPVPTYTPAILSRIANPSYKLREWTAEQADLMIDQIASHLKAIEDDPEYGGTDGREQYRDLYQYLASAESEALLRFPDAPRAETWHWDVCYNLAFSYPYPEATDAPELPCYAKLIEDGLNSGQADLSKLSKWFGKHESRFSVEAAAHTPPQGYTSSQIITLDNNAFIWVTEKGGKFQATGLMSSMFFFRETSAKFQVIDLTGDQFPELVLYFRRAYCCGQFSYQFIYDIASGTPTRLTFTNLDGTQSNLSSEYDSSITKLDDGEAMPGLVFKSHYGNPLSQACDLRQYDKYNWNNTQFELVKTWYEIDKPEEDQKACQFAIDTPTNQDEIDAVAHAIRKTQDRQVAGFQQLVLFGLGEYYAKLGNYEKAYPFFSNVATSPSSNEPTSEWIQAAREMLKHYKTADQFYSACASVKQCDIQKALQQAIENINPALFPTVSEALQAIGVPVKSAGVFDFYEDGSAEQWIVVQHPGTSEYKFWILVKGQQKIDAIFIATLANATPVINRFIVPNERTIIELKIATGKILFSLEKMNLSVQPYILLASPPRDTDDDQQQTFTNAFWQEPVDHAAAAIFTGANPLSIKENLLGLKQSRHYDCKTYPCDQLYYFLGLANELAGDTPSAVEAYQVLWQTYPDSIYTIMARSKLE